MIEYSFSFYQNQNMSIKLEASKSVEPVDLSSMLETQLKMSEPIGSIPSPKYEETDFYSRAKRYFKFENLDENDIPAYILAVLDYFTSDSPKASVQSVAEGTVLMFFNFLFTDFDPSAYEATETRQKTQKAVPVTNYNNWKQFVKLIRKNEEYIDGRPRKFVTEELIECHRNWTSEEGVDKKGLPHVLRRIGVSQSSAAIDFAKNLLCATTKSDTHLMNRFASSDIQQWLRDDVKINRNRVSSFCKFMYLKYISPSGVLFSCVDEMIDNGSLTNSDEVARYQQSIQMRTKFYGMNCVALLIKIAIRMRESLGALLKYLEHLTLNESIITNFHFIGRLFNREHLMDEGVTPFAHVYPNCYARMIDNTLLEDLSNSHHAALIYLCSSVDILLRDGNAKIEHVYRNKSTTSMPQEYYEMLWKKAYDIMMKHSKFDLFYNSGGNPYFAAALARLGIEDQYKGISSSTQSTS